MIETVFPTAPYHVHRSTTACRQVCMQAGKGRLQLMAC
jgi:hypothetical protein